MSVLKRVLVVFLLLVVAPLALLALLEGTLSFGYMARDFRAIPPAGNPLGLRYDSLVGWTAPAEQARGAQGSAPAGQTIVCSGDELTYGLGVADSATYCAKLAGLVAGTRVVNLGERGYDVGQSYLLYRREGGTSRRLHIFAVTAPAVDRLSQPTFQGYPKPRIVARGNTLAPDRAVPHWTVADRDQQAGQIWKESRLVQLLDRLGLSASRRSDNAAVGDSIIAHLAGEGTGLAVVYLPNLSDLLPGRGDALRAHLAKVAQTFNVPFVDLAAEIRTVDPDSVEWMFITPGAQQVPGSARSYTARGHAWIAERLAAHLAQSGLTLAAAKPR